MDSPDIKKVVKEKRAMGILMLRLSGAGGELVLRNVTFLFFHFAILVNVDDSRPSMAM